MVKSTGKIPLRAVLGITVAALSAQPIYAKSPSPQEQLQTQAARMPEVIEQLITTKGDALDPRIEVSSFRATQIVTHGLLGSQTYEDSFLRAYVDKTTKQVSVQIYHVASYSGSGWSFYNRATYQTNGELKEVEVERVSSDVDCQSYSCSYTEELVFPVDFLAMEKTEAQYAAGQQVTGIPYRLFARSGAQIDGGMLANEVIAFVRAVHRVQGK